METIKVNMNPNPLDVQTIHASQNDTEARQWEFELHNNGELIDTSEITEQMFFKAYKGGTEQLLPENTSTPTTSPFNGDIRYPQGLLNDQEFTYRQSPTEEDGNAKITDIKGNTLNWNQLVNGFPATTEWNGIAITNNDGKSITLNGTYTGSSTGNLYVSLNNISADPTHWYLYDFSNVNLENMIIRISSGVNTGSLHGGSTINTVTSAVSGRLDLRIPVSKSFDNVKIVPQMFDLTQMFGAEIAQQLRDMELETFGKGVAYFRSLFPLSYYSYNQGSLLSFMGNGIKTVGKNRWDSTRLYGASSSATLNNGVYIKNANGSNWIINTESNSYAAMPVLFEANQSIVLSYKIENSTVNSAFLCVVYEDGTTRNFPNAVNGFTTLLPKKVVKAGVVLYGTFTANSSKIYDIQLEIGTSATSYEHYDSSTLSLPISTYFPSGMKSAGTVYDELTPSKAITRIGEIDFGSLTWKYDADYQLWVSTSGITNSDQGCLLNANIPYQAIGLSDTSKLGSKINNTYNIWVRNGSNTIQPSGIAYYILASSTETSFNTASLVTENAEIPLSNNDGTLIGKCTEELSENPGFIDAKIKLSDSDGKCYSNKIQLHVERSPK